MPATRIALRGQLSCLAVRFRGSCLVEDPGSWNQGLTGAIESVLRNHTKPAVLAIDAW